MPGWFRHCTVIKHRAPNGALRQVLVLADRALDLGHKAPSAKRRIKTARIHCSLIVVFLGH